VGGLVKHVWGQDKHADFDISNAIKQDIVTLDITMNDVLAMQVGQPFAGLRETKDQKSRISLCFYNWTQI
jgi:hypothetical protein